MLLLFITSCGDASVRQKADYTVDHSDPTAVVQAVFDVAAGASASILADLCDPEGRHDPDTRRICELSEGYDPEGEFALYFRNGEIVGQTSMHGDTASVPIRYGPGKPRDAQMRLILREGKWYLIDL